MDHTGRVEPTEPAVAVIASIVDRRNYRDLRRCLRCSADAQVSAMSELLRVLRPGGRIVVADADHLATVVYADDREVAEQVQTASARLGSGNPAAGRRLRSQMVMAGFVGIEVKPEPLVITDRTRWTTIEPSRVEGVLAALVADGEVTVERAAAHLADLARRQEQNRFLAVLPGYSVIGGKPVPAKE